MYFIMYLLIPALPFSSWQQRMWALSICALNLPRGTRRSGTASPTGGFEFIKPLITLVSLFSRAPHPPRAHISHLLLCTPDSYVQSKPQLTDIHTAPATSER